MSPNILAGAAIGMVAYERFVLFSFGGRVPEIARMQLTIPVGSEMGSQKGMNVGYEPLSKFSGNLRGLSYRRPILS